MSYSVVGYSTRLLSFLLIFIQTRYLTVSEFGILSMLEVIVLSFSLGSKLGLPNGIFRFFEDSPQFRKRLFATAFISIFALSLLCFVVGNILATQLGIFFIGSDRATLFVRLALVTATFEALGEVPRTFLRASRQIKVFGFLAFFQAGLGIAMTCWLVIAKGEGVKGVILSGLIAEASAFLILVYKWRSHFSLGWNFSLARSLFNYSFPFVVHQIDGAGLTLLAQLLVRRILGLEMAGLFSLSLKMTLPIRLVVKGIQDAWAPIKFSIVATQENPAENFRSALVYYIVCMGFGWVFVSSWGPILVEILTPDKFHEAGKYICLLSLIPVVHGTFSILSAGLEIGTRTRSFMMVSFLGLVAVGLGCLALVPPFGIFGAGLSIILSWLLMAILIFSISQRHFSIDHSWLILIATALTAFGLVFGGRSLPVSEVYRAVVTTFAFPALALAILKVSKSERERARAFIDFLFKAGARGRG